MSHSGYAFARHHDDHHRAFTGNFGMVGFSWDAICGTRVASKPVEEVLDKVGEEREERVERKGAAEAIVVERKRTLL